MEDDFQRNNVHYMTFIATLWHKNLCLGRPFFGHHYYNPSISDLLLGSGEKDIQRNTSIFYHFVTLISL